MDEINDFIPPEKRMLKKIAQLQKVIEYINYHLNQRLYEIECIREKIKNDSELILNRSIDCIDKNYFIDDKQTRKNIKKIEKRYASEVESNVSDYRDLCNEVESNVNKLYKDLNLLVKTTSEFKVKVFSSMDKATEDFLSNDNLKPQYYIDLIKIKLDEHLRIIKVHDDESKRKYDQYIVYSEEKLKRIEQENQCQLVKSRTIGKLNSKQKIQQNKLFVTIKDKLHDLRTDILQQRKIVRDLLRNKLSSLNELKSRYRISNQKISTELKKMRRLSESELKRVNTDLLNLSASKNILEMNFREKISKFKSLQHEKYSLLCEMKERNRNEFQEYLKKYAEESSFLLPLYNLKEQLEKEIVDHELALKEEKLSISNSIKSLENAISSINAKLKIDHSTYNSHVIGFEGDDPCNGRETSCSQVEDQRYKNVLEYRDKLIAELSLLKCEIFNPGIDFEMNRNEMEYNEKRKGSVLSIASKCIEFVIEESLHILKINDRFHSTKPGIIIGDTSEDFEIRLDELFLEFRSLCDNFDENGQIFDMDKFQNVMNYEKLEHEGGTKEVLNDLKGGKEVEHSANVCYSFNINHINDSQESNDDEIRRRFQDIRKRLYEEEKSLGDSMEAIKEVCSAKLSNKDNILSSLKFELNQLEVNSKESLTKIRDMYNKRINYLKKLINIENGKNGSESESSLATTSFYSYDPTLSKRITTENVEPFNNITGQHNKVNLSSEDDPTTILRHYIERARKNINDYVEKAEDLLKSNLERLLSKLKQEEDILNEDIDEIRSCLKIKRQELYELKTSLSRHRFEKQHAKISIKEYVGNLEKQLLEKTNYLSKLTKQLESLHCETLHENSHPNITKTIVQTRPHATLPNIYKTNISQNKRVKLIVPGLI